MEEGKPPQRTPWYYGIVSVLIAIFLLGPFAFPLLWKSPRFTLVWKIIITFLVTVATIYLAVGTWQLVELFIQEFRRLQLV